MNEITKELAELQAFKKQITEFLNLDYIQMTTDA